MSSLTDLREVVDVIIGVDTHVHTHSAAVVETGTGAGEGFTLNYPMPPGTPFSVWRKSLADALQKIADYAPDALVVSLGVDTFETDPISFFKLKSPDFATYGTDIAQLGLPTLFVMEGGYDIDEIGLNTVNVLQGFLGTA